MIYNFLILTIFSFLVSFNWLTTNQAEERDDFYLIQPDSQLSIDSTVVVKINSLRDSIIESKKNYYLIVKDHQDYECYRTDSIFYNENSELSLNISRFGCLDEESLVYKVYKTGELIYYEETKFGDGIRLEKDILYFDNFKIFLAIKYEFKVNWDKRAIIDSTTNYLDPYTLSTKRYIKDNFTSNIFTEISSLKNFKSNIRNEQIIFTDTISFEPSSIIYRMDSSSYNFLIK